MTEDPHALTEAAEQLRKAAAKTHTVCQWLTQCADRIDSLGQLDTDSAEALAASARLLNGSD